MLDRITQFIARHGMLAPGQRIGVAVSGGADSVFLLHALRELGYELSVVHIEHGIRGAASLEDAEFVRALAANFGLPFHLRRANVLAHEGNIEEAGRNVRQGYYAELIASGAVDRVATGHTRSDQAETVLFRILRGSGLTGLSGILPVTGEGLVRPLLEIDRSEIEAWLRARSIAWREDSTNQDRAYARNRLRHEILPLLRERFNPQLDAALAQLAMIARDEESYWASELRPRSPIPNPGSPRVLSISELTSIPVAAARRRLHATVPGASFAHIERILEMARSDHGHDRFQVPGLDICRSFDWIRIAPTGIDETSDYAFHLGVPDSVELPGGGGRITLQLLDKQVPGAPYVTVGSELDWQRFSGGRNEPRLELRNWRPGDQYRRIGRAGPEKIKFLFQQARIPLWERGNWPIITYNETIVWARRFGAAAEFAGGPDTRSVLHVAETEPHISNHANEWNPRNGL